MHTFAQKKSLFRQRLCFSSLICCIVQYFVVILAWFLTDYAMVTTKIQIDQHLAEYCVGKWGIEFQPPVRFPDWTELYVKIHDLTQKRPVDAPVDSGNLEIVIPNRRADSEQPVRKNPDVYNYLSARSVKNIQRQIRAMMRMELHEFMVEQKHKYGVDYIDSAHEFKCK